MVIDVYSSFSQKNPFWIPTPFYGVEGKKVPEGERFWLGTL